MLTYDECGQGVPILLLGGTPFDRSYWTGLVPRLRGRVIACDLRGHGDSSKLGGPYDIPTHAADVLALLSQLRIPKAVFVGHSLGGYVALEVLRQTPDRVLGLVIIGSAIRSEPQNNLAERDLVADAVATGQLALDSEQVLEILYSTESLARVRESAEALRPSMRRFSPAVAAAELRSIARRHDARAALAAATIPLAVVLAERDIYLDVAKVMKDAGGRAMLIADTGHMLPVEAPAQLAKAIMSIVERVPKDS